VSTSNKHVKNNSLLDLTTELTDLQNGFQGIDTKIGDLSSTVLQLNSSVLELQEALSNISTLCGGDPTCLSLIPQSQQIMLEFNENVSFTNPSGQCMV
jgi:prefoldin subunit 5